MCGLWLVASLSVTDTCPCVWGVAQDQNFSLFNYVAEQNNEIERLEEQAAQLLAEESKHSEELGDDASQVGACVGVLSSCLLPPSPFSASSCALCHCWPLLCFAAATTRFVLSVQCVLVSDRVCGVVPWTCSTSSC
jgi:hypothetical protein